jgi:hypothetical protein
MHEEQIRNDVIQLAQPDGRMVGTSGHDVAAEYLIERLGQLGVDPYVGGSFALPYETDGQRFINLVGQIPGLNPDLPPVLLGAHYDTCGPYPGADDNAAAVAVVLAVAGTLVQTQAERTVIFALFDAEKPPHFQRSSMGSTRFYEDQRTGQIHCAIILDLVGHDIPVTGMSDLLFITGMESDPGLERVVQNCAPTDVIRTVPTLNRYVGDLSDHGVFRVNERPYLFLTCGLWEHYHAHSDTPDRLNYSKIAAVAEYAQALIEQVSGSDLNGPFETYSTLETELHFLRQNVAPVVRGMGLPVSLRSRQDIDKLVDPLIYKLGL